MPVKNTNLENVKIYLNPSPTIPPIPILKDKTKVDIRYELISPYVFAHLFWDENQKELVYNVEEPILSENQKEMLNKIEESMLEVINIDIVVEKTQEAMINYINKTANLIINQLSLEITEEDYRRIFYFLYRDFVGMNEIESLLRDYFIEDIECNGIDTPIYIVHRVYKNMKTNVSFDSINRIASFVEKLAQRCGKYVSYASPILDGTLPDGSRVNATYTQEITSRGPTFCFKKGKVQLADGNVKEVEKLFQEAKSSFGSSFEKEDEIVKPINLDVCGVNENTLEQEKSKITSLIKLKSPEKLMKISFEDGGEVEVTINHKFHIAEDTLKLIEAKDLKEGMIVPMPKKIISQGYRQKIDVYSLIRDFSYSKHVAIINSPEIKNLVCAEIVASGSDYRTVLSQKYNVGKTYFYEIISRGNSIAFNVLDKLCVSREKSLESIGDISLNVYGGGTKNKSKAVKIPKEIDEDLAYLAGALISDGHISASYIDFSCYEKSVGNSVKECLLRKFGRFDSYYNDNRIYLCNLFIPYYFNKVFGIPIGNKSRIVQVPEKIFKSDNVVIASFLKGLFDGDGTASAGLSYKTYSESLAEGITYLLARLGIYSYVKKDGVEVRLNIPSPYYKLFSNLVGFNSDSKKSLLNLLVERQVSFKTQIRHNRIPGAPILSIIKKIGLTRADLLRDCSIGTHNRFNYITFSRDFAKAMLNEISKSEKASLVQEELSYLHWLISSDQEFVKIEKVDMINNSDPVYDLELSPCKFFVAGNKPMNMFDTIRKFTKIPWTPTQLITFKTLSPEMLAYIWILIQYKCNILIAGGTASGKTTLLNGISFFIPPEARVVSIEDTRELSLSRENWLPSVARSNVGLSNVGEVSLFSLLKSSFRQNPDYVIVGEVRGEEANVLFQGMASGHSSLSTIHADSVDTLIKRLETPPINLSPTLVNTIDAVAIMTHAIANKQETRKLREIVEVVEVDPNGIASTNTPFVWNAREDVFYFKKSSHVFEKIARRYGFTTEELEKEFKLRTLLLNELANRKIYGFKEVQDIINYYLKSPENILKMFGVIS